MTDGSYPTYSVRQELEEIKLECPNGECKTHIGYNNFDAHVKSCSFTPLSLANVHQPDTLEGLQLENSELTKNLRTFQAKVTELESEMVGVKTELRNTKIALERAQRALSQTRRESPGEHLHQNRTKPGQNQRESPGQNRRESPGQNIRTSGEQNRRESPGQNIINSPGQNRREIPGQRSSQHSQMTRVNCILRKSY